MKNGKLQAKDITDQAILGAIDSIVSERDDALHYPTVSWWTVAETLSLNEKLTLSKLRSMVKRKVLDCQCTCGCRGDYVRLEMSPWS